MPPCSTAYKGASLVVWRLAECALDLKLWLRASATCPKTSATWLKASAKVLAQAVVVVGHAFVGVVVFLGIFLFVGYAVSHSVLGQKGGARHTFWKTFLGNLEEEFSISHFLFLILHWNV